MKGMTMGKYDDILSLPHHQSSTRPHMSPRSRAAQFAPFAALVGYDAAVAETARLTAGDVELDESAVEILNAKLQLLCVHLAEEPEASVTWFMPDKKKAGGAQVTASGPVKKIDDIAHTVIMADGTAIPINAIRDITCEGLFDCFI